MELIRKVCSLGAALAIVLGGAGASEAATGLSSCGRITTPGNYVVGNDLMTSGTCFTIQADNVAIDFQGHKLTGPGPRGIYDDGVAHVGIVITRGTITGFISGIDLNSSSFVTVDRMN